MVDFDQTTEAEALATCESEPIRSPDRVQSHGGLIAASPDLGNITHVSKNIQEFTGYSPNFLLENTLEHVLGAGDLHTIRNVLSVSSIATQREFLGQLSWAPKPFGSLHIRGRKLILELTHGRSTMYKTSFGLERLRWLLGRQRRQMKLEPSLQAMVRELRAIIDFDRVMALRFRPDGSGEVLAESRVDTMESFLGLRFPRQDVPQTARDICLEQPIRVIANTGAQDIDILSNGRDPEPLDLTLAELRGTSPVHRQYLRNMSVGASLVLPVVTDQGLWGVFTCHHRQPKLLSVEETAVFDLVGQMLNGSIDVLVKHELALDSAQCEIISSRLGRDVSGGPNLLFSRKGWAEFSEKIMDVLKVEGVYLRVNDRFNYEGIQPDEKSRVILERLSADAGDGTIWCASEGILEHCAAQKIAGVMRINLFADNEVCLWLYRREEQQVIHWAGPPKKEIEKTARETRLHPRSSFKSYEEMSKGASRAWEAGDLLFAEALQASLSRAVTSQLGRIEQEFDHELILREFGHRVQNIIAVVQALLRNAPGKKLSVEEYRQELEDRLMALARVHRSFPSNEREGVLLKTIVEQALDPFDPVCFAINGPDVSLSAAATTVLSLVIHELATNALKHGALSAQGGKVAVNWQVAKAGLQFHWAESGAGLVSEPADAGFGLTLIREAVEFQVGGISKIEFRPEGIEVFIEIPPGHLSDQKPIGGSPPQYESVLPQLGNTVELGRVLVVEDDFLIAMQYRSFLLKNGAREVVIARDNDVAIDLIDDGPLDCAVVDLTLGREDSRRTLRKLQTHEIPVIAISGESSHHRWLNDFNLGLPLEKPFRYESLLAELQSVLKPEPTESRR